MNDQELRQTPLYDTHLELGAKMINFAGWEMPVKYESIIKEHKYVRDNAGVFDISHMGEFLLTGQDTFPLLQKLMVNDLNLLEVGKGQYSCMCYENGTVVDDMIYYMLSPNNFRMIVNASNREKDFNWIQSQMNGLKVELSNVSDMRCRLAFQGPKTDEYLNTLTDIDVKEIQRFYFREIYILDNPVFIARTGYTGERGFELSFNKKYVNNIWNALLETGAKPIGLGARDTLRLEATYSLYGHELSDQITPVEANIGWVVKNKDVEFNGKEILLKQKKEGTDRILVGLNLLERGVIRENYEIYKNDEKIGYVTSGGYSPTLDKTIGLGLVKTEYRDIDTKLKIKIRDKFKEAIVVSTPFYQNV